VRSRRLSIVLVFRMDCFSLRDAARARARARSKSERNIKLRLARFDTRQSRDAERSANLPLPLPRRRRIPVRLINLLMSSAVPLPSRVSSISCAAFPRSYGVLVAGIVTGRTVFFLRDPPHDKFCLSRVVLARSVRQRQRRQRRKRLVLKPCDAEQNGCCRRALASPKAAR